MLDQCDLNKSSSSDCRLSCYRPQEDTLVRLHQCGRSVQGHLASLKIHIEDVSSEGQLIARRVGLFTDWANKTVCPRHRYEIGLHWKPPVRCLHPTHEGKAKPFRPVNSAMSFTMWQSTGIVLPIGSGICRRCHDRITHLEKSAEVLKVLDKIDRSSIDSYAGGSNADVPNDFGAERTSKKIPSPLTEDCVLDSDEYQKKEVKNLSVAQTQTGLVIKEPANQENITLGLSSRSSRQADTATQNETEITDSNCTQQEKFFLCPESGCTKKYQTVSSLESHILLGRHTYKLERISTFDKIKIQWSEVCQNMSEASRRHFTPYNNSSEIDTPCSVTEGWALKKGRKVIKFSQQVKDFLKDLYHNGEKNKKKVNPADAAKYLRQARKTDGSKMFSPEEYLQTAQIASFFSRLTVQSQKQIEMNGIDDRDLEGLVMDIQQEEATRELIAS